MNEAHAASAAAQAAGKAAATAPTEPMYSVFDPAASGEYDGSTPAKKRHHTLLIEGVEIAYHFTHGTATKMEFAPAMRFAKAGFTVRDPSGRLVTSSHDALDGAGNAPTIAIHEVIAALNELTIPALVKRAVLLPGGSRFGGNSSREELVAFLTKARQAAQVVQAPAVGTGRPMDESAAPENAEAMSGDAFDRAFGAAKQGEEAA